jgi:hypothetical protein
MEVEINNLKLGEEVTTYIASREEDCRDETDLAVYRLCVEHDDTIAMGQCIGTPMRIIESKRNGGW